MSEHRYSWDAATHHRELTGRKCRACDRGWHHECWGCACDCNREVEIGTCQTCGGYFDAILTKVCPYDGGYIG